MRLIHLIIGLLLLMISVQVQAEKATSTISKGQQLTQKLCQACHAFPGATQAGNVGPPFKAIKSRFPDRKALTNIIHDPQIRNPDTMMPPFGRNGLVDAQGIDNIIDFLYTL